VDTNDKSEEAESNGDTSKTQKKDNADLLPNRHLQGPGQGNWKCENCNVRQKADNRICDDNSGLAQASRIFTFGLSPIGRDGVANKDLDESDYEVVTDCHTEKTVQGYHACIKWLKYPDQNIYQAALDEKSCGCINGGCHIGDLRANELNYSESLV
jgi:hypothetical protein